MPTTILVDVQLQRTDTGEHDASLQELRQLIETLGWKIAGTLTQKMSSLTAASLIGPGKLEELSELLKAQNPHPGAGILTGSPFARRCKVHL